MINAEVLQRPIILLSSQDEHWEFKGYDLYVRPLAVTRDAIATLYVMHDHEKGASVGFRHEVAGPAFYCYSPEAQATLEQALRKRLEAACISYRALIQHSASFCSPEWTVLGPNDAPEDGSTFFQQWT